MILLTLSSWEGYGQQTVFALLRNELNLADEYYDEKNFDGALRLYLNASRRDPDRKETTLRIARCYYFLKQYAQAINFYDDYIKAKRNLPWTDMYAYAESQASSSNYEKAAEYYRMYMAKEPENDRIIKKIWRLNNIQYLFEDSMHYAVRPISLNTEFGELCGVPYQNGIVFMSNRKAAQPFEKVDAAVNAPFYQVYFSKVLPDTVTGTNRTSRYGKASVFSKELTSRFHAGPVAFYDKARKMVFVSSASGPGAGGARTLQLYFAESDGRTWKVTQSFPYNKAQHSITDPTISQDGKMLFFSSDMTGGFGGKDIYRSEFIDGRWTRPVNLGEVINTPYDEVFPYIHEEQMLYFSSNGHAGMGGLDIFKAAVKADGFDEAQNAGYPLNSSYDDFGIVIDSLDTHGYFSSNRKNGGYNDDLYEFDIDLQKFPLTITGLIKFKEHAWSDSSELTKMPNVKVYLIDNLRNATIYEGASDATGNFSVVIPYFSKYIIRVVSEDGEENRAVLEIPKHQKDLSAYEVVMVRDIFNPQKNQSKNEAIK